MANRNIMEALQNPPEGGSPKHAYPLSAHQYYTSKPGMLTVVDFIGTVPNEDLQVGVDNYTMTKILNTKNFARMKENFYFIHVPISQLDRAMHQVLMQRTESVSALEFNNIQSVTFDLGEAVREAIQMSGITLEEDVDHLYHDIHGFNIGCGAIRLFDMLGYGCYVDIMEAYMSQALPYDGVVEICKQIKKYPPVYPLLAYQKAWHSFFRNDIYHEVSPKCFNVDDVSYGTEDNVYDVIAKRESVGTFIRQCCQLRYVQHKKDWLTAAMPGTQYGVVSAVPLKSDIQITGSFDTGGSFQRYTVSSEVTTPNTPRIWANEEGKQGTMIPSDSTDTISHTHNVSLSYPGNSLTIENGTSLFDVLQLVEANAIQKWRQKSMLAGNKIKNQYRAHHGVVPKDLFDYTPDFIGSVDNIIDVSSIESLADTATEAGTSNLGQLAGRGRGQSDKRLFKFHSDTYGILLVLRAIVPENTYSSYGLDMENTQVYYSDYFQTEFQNLGLRPVPKYAMDVLAPNNTPGSAVNGDTPDVGLNYYPDAVGVRGFAPPYFFKKQRLSKVHGLFNPTRLRISKYTGNNELPDDVYWPDDVGNEFGYNDMQSFVSVMSDYNSFIDVILVREDADSEYEVDRLELRTLDNEVSQLYVSPSMCNSLFAFDADDSQSTDQFIHWSYVILNAHAPFSPLGLPQF